MASKLKNLSVLINDQLPDFIASEYPKFSSFLAKYYEHLELPGQPIDLISNLTKYRNSDTYTKENLSNKTKLTSTIFPTDTTINVLSTKGFPSVNGYILIDDEVIFYKSKTATSFVNCYRNVSETTVLGDLYTENQFNAVPYSEVGTGNEHISNKTVSNVSNLFLYALVKNFEVEFLQSFPTRSLKDDVDKSVLIKNIKRFYETKGTEQSIGIIFNAVVSKEPNDVPTVYYPKDSTYKLSSSNWINTYSLKVKILNANPADLLGEKIVQEETIYDSSIKSSFAVIDNIKDIGNGFTELILADSSIVGEFAISPRTVLKKDLLSTDNLDDRINVYSTQGWNSNIGAVIINNELITFKDKTVNQFVINTRSQNTSYSTETEVFGYSNVYVDYTDSNGNAQRASIVVLGVLYNLLPSNNVPYSVKDDVIQISESGFETRDRIIYNKSTENIRWILNENNLLASSTVSGLDGVLHSVSAIFEDEQYYYIASSGYPAHQIGLPGWSQTLKDQKQLKLIRKTPSSTTEIYRTEPNEVGILLNGTTVRSYKGKDEDLVVYGEITNVQVTNQGSGYVNPPNILIQDGAGEIVASAKAVLNGSVVERIDIVESGSGFFPPVPEITITSGRNAVVEAIVTKDKVTGLVIKNPGEYYSSPPRIVIRDTKGKGRFASYTAEISNDGKLVGFVKNDEGKFYTQENIEVIVEPVGSGASAVSIVRTWRKNLVVQHQNSLDANYGFYFKNNVDGLGYGYSYLANPKALRVTLGDNLDNIGNVPPTLSHSPILGYAFDGNPIYGPYGYSDSLDSTSSISRMMTSYSLRNSRVGGPTTTAYSLGYFVEDYEYIHRSGDLDENNGRFCVTPEYPEGTYAYFVTINSANVPVFPYIVGENFYSLPVDSNYNKTISQDQLPKNISRLRTANTTNDGEGIYALIDNVLEGTVNEITVESTPNTFSVGGSVEFDYTSSNGSGIVASVESIKGLNVTSIESQQTKAIKIDTQTPIYVFEGDTITQETTNAQGEIIGNVFDDKTVVLRNISGTFNSTNTLTSSTSVTNLILDQSSDYTLNAEVVLTNGKQVVILNANSNKINVASNPFVDDEPIIFSNTFSGVSADTIYYVVDSQPVSFKVSTTIGGSPITLVNNANPGAVAISQKAKGLVLENTLQRNALKLKNLQGVFEVDSNYFIKSNNIADTIGSVIVSINSLSSGIKPLKLNDNIAIVQTASEHGIAKGEIVDIDISPDDSTTETTIYTRRRIYQKVKLNVPSYTKYLTDTGIGRLVILNNGSYNAQYSISSVARSNNVATITTTTAHNFSIGDEVTISNISGYAATNVTISAVTSNTFSYGNIGPNQSTNSVTTGTVGESVGDYAYSYTNKSHVFNNVELLFANISECRDADGRIVGDSDTAYIGRPGSINNAKANITVANGIVTNISIIIKGRGYKKGDIIAVNSDDLDRNPSSTSTRFLICEVDHVGFSDSNSILYLNNVNSISEQDYLKIGTEIVQVTSINTSNSYVTVDRAQNNTTVSDHYNTQEVVSNGPSYDLPINYQLGSNASDPYVLSYDQDTSEMTVVYGVDRLLSNINKLVPNIAFFDNSTPQKLVTVSDSTEDIAYKYEFSYDNTNWTRNPVINVQKYYKYKFDTSHYTLRGSFLEFSPSANFNIITSESVRNDILPGNAGSFVTLKIGYGPALDNNTYTNKVISEFNTYFYFDKNRIIDSDRSYIRVYEDPLQGRKTITFVTPTKFVYEMNDIPKYDGSGNISYTTTSLLAKGEINSIRVSNQGSNFLLLPSVKGVVPSIGNECLATVNWNQTFENISSITINYAGKNYSKPEAVLVSSTGSGAKFELLTNSLGEITAIVTKNKGSGYKTPPVIKIIETDLKMYCKSSSIGLPKSTRILFNGQNISKDVSLRKIFTGSRILVLKNISNSNFKEGEKILQYEGSTLIASGYVAKNGWREKNNVIRLRNIVGEFQVNGSIIGQSSLTTADISESIASFFNFEVKSFFDNLGKYTSDKGHLSSNNQRLLDSYFYQDYSYVIKSKTPMSEWRDVIKNTTHPAGFQLFGEVSIESNTENKIPTSQPNLSTISIVQLWDPTTNKISVENTYRTLTQSTINVANSNVVRGGGSAYAPAFDTGETVAYEITLSPNFDGYFNAQGNRQGTTTFNINLLGTNTPYSVPKDENLIISLDGIMQEPGVAYTVSGTQITFSKAPLGYRSVFGDPIPFSSYREGVDSPSQKIVGRIIRFKDTTLNSQYFRKVQDISSQFDGVQTTFDLYYEGGGAVELNANENLLVSIDGVVQRAGLTPLLPGDRAYYIRKTVSPNQIVFVEPPRIFSDQKQSFYAFSVGNYERLKLDDRFIDGVNNGPFILRSSLTNKTITVDEDRNVLVFVDQVLQKRTKDYTIRGSNITFTNPILIGQQVNIIYLYGRETAGVITAFDYDLVPWYNRIDIEISGTPMMYSHSATLISNSATGKLRAHRQSGGNTILTVDVNNNTFVSSESFTIKYEDPYYPNLTISSSDIVSISDFEENDSQQDILRKDSPGWLRFNSSLAENRDYIQKGDLVKIDGEDSYREVFSTPETVIKTDYRTNDSPSSSYFGKLSTSVYNGIARGEGLDVVAEIDNGKVVALLWNKIEWGQIFTKRITPSSPGYGYETAPKLEFVSQPQKDPGGNIIAGAQGGGAKAYVVVHGGQVIDIVLYDQGSDYLVPPSVFVTRSFDLIRNNRQINSISYLSLSPETLVGGTLYVSTGDRLDADVPPQVSISSFALVTPFDTEEQITAIIQKEVDSRISSQTVIQHTSELNLGIDISSISMFTDKIDIIFETPAAFVETFNKVTIVNSTQEILSQVNALAAVNYLLAYRSAHETGAFLMSSMSSTIDVAYVADTQKFLDSGKLLIEDEVVYYASKLSDRFLDLIRGDNGTTAKPHAAGSFVRQYREEVSIIDVGFVGTPVVESEVRIITISDISASITEIIQIESEVSLQEVEIVKESIIEVVAPDVTVIDSRVSNITSLIQPTAYINTIAEVSLAHLTVLESKVNTVSQSTIQRVDIEIERDRNVGFIDYYIENYVLENPITTRFGSVTLDDPYNEVFQRDGTIIFVINAPGNNEGDNKYYRTSLTNRMAQYDEWKYMDTGSSGASTFTLDQIDHTFNRFIIRDFEVNAHSSFAESGAIWNYGYPSIQNPVTIVSSTGSIGAIVTVASTNYFANSGYLYHSDGTTFGVIQYTGKTSTTFTGCTVYSGSSTISNTSEIIPYSI